MAQTYQSMGYREIQKYNSSLLREYQNLDVERKNQGLSNRGWKQVIILYEWLNARVGKVATLLKNIFLMEQSAVEIKETIIEANQLADQTLTEIKQSQDKIRQKIQPDDLILKYSPQNNIVQMGVK